MKVEMILSGLITAPVEILLLYTLINSTIKLFLPVLIPLRSGIFL